MTQVTAVEQSCGAVMFIQLLFAMGMEAEVMVMQEGAGERMLSSFLF